MILKCYSWNVNGFRAILQHGFMNWLKIENPDFIALQEIRTNWDQVDVNVRQWLCSMFNICWFPCIMRNGYAGSAVLTKRGLDFLHSRGLGIKIYDQEGRIIISRLYDIIFISGYFPNASSDLMRLVYKHKFMLDLLRFVKNQRILGKKVILVGDINIAPEEIDLAKPKDNFNKSGFTDIERQDFRFYLDAGLVDVFRIFNPYLVKQYTWWTMRGRARENDVGWRIDHFLVDQLLFHKVNNVILHKNILGSDHCPISIELNY